MSETTTVIRLRQPGEIDDPLTEVLRAVARQLLAQANEAEVAAFLTNLKDEKLPDGRERVARHGHGPERMIQTGIAPVPVQRAKVRDRARCAGGAENPVQLGAAAEMGAPDAQPGALLPILYLRGISTGDFQEVLTALLGTDAPSLSPSVVARLTADWEGEYERCLGGDLRGLAMEAEARLADLQFEVLDHVVPVGSEPSVGSVTINVCVKSVDLPRGINGQAHQDAVRPVFQRARHRPHRRHLQTGLTKVEASFMT